MRLLLVAMAHSIHTVRWAAQFSEMGWDIHLFPSDDGRPHTSLQQVTLHDQLAGRPAGLAASVRSADDFWPLRRGGWPLPRGRGLARRLLARRWPQWHDRAWRLARVICALRPDVIHSMEIHKAGTLVLRARQHLGCGGPPWIVTNWGSDIFLWGRIPGMAENIRPVLDAGQYYIGGCQRDVELAREFGYQGPASVLPLPGGEDLEEMCKLRQSGPPAARRVIALKGYQDWAGRALAGLQALEMCADALQGYTVVIYSAAKPVEIAAQLMAQSTGLPVEIMPPATREQILRLHGRARISIGLSISDGPAQSCIEAMCMGSFPIQSNTSCADEWLSDGQSGFMVPYDDPAAIAAAIRRAATDDDLVNRAAEYNLRQAAEHLDRSVVRQRAAAIYEAVAAQAAAVPGSL